MPRFVWCATMSVLICALLNFVYFYLFFFCSCTNEAHNYNWYRWYGTAIRFFMQLVKTTKKNLCPESIIQAVYDPSNPLIKLIHKFSSPFPFISFRRSNFSQFFTIFLFFCFNFVSVCVCARCISKNFLLLLKKKKTKNKDTASVFAGTVLLVAYTR